jgi:carotenoid cleavage dioxygenase
MNAYDDGDTIVVDVVGHPKMFDRDRTGPNEGPATLDRWTVDLADGKLRGSRFDDRADRAVGEFVFHPSYPNAAEDDGVLMGYVYDRHTDRSELAILNTHILQDVASIKLPHRVPAGLHGNWVPTVNSKQRRG